MNRSISWVKPKGVLLLLCVVFFWFSGCEPLEPEIEIAAVPKVQKVTAEGLDLLVKLSIYNPNRFAVKFSHLNYMFLVHNEVIGQGTLAEEQRIDKRSTKIVELPLHISFEDLPEAVAKTLKNKITPYSIRGSCEARALIARQIITFDISGEIDLRNALVNTLIDRLFRSLGIE